MANQSGGPRLSGKSNRGFASMDPVRQRQIASQGGRAARANATPHQPSTVQAPRLANDGNSRNN